jgi:hypothetical protein
MVSFASSSTFLPLCLLSLLFVPYMPSVDARLQSQIHGPNRRHHPIPNSSTPTVLPPPDFEINPSFSTSPATPFVDDDSLSRRPITKRAVDSSIPSGFTYLGCTTDGNPRALTGTFRQSNAISQTTCIGYCSDRGYIYSGTQAGNQCWCGNFFENGRGLATTGCNTPCAGELALTVS